MNRETGHGQAKLVAGRPILISTVKRCKLTSEMAALQPAGLAKIPVQPHKHDSQQAALHTLRRDAPTTSSCQGLEGDESSALLVLLCFCLINV